MNRAGQYLRSFLGLEGEIRRASWSVLGLGGSDDFPQGVAQGFFIEGIKHRFTVKDLCMILFQAIFA